MSDSVLVQPDETTSSSVVNQRSGTSIELIVLAFPMMISFLSHTLMSVADTYIIGRVGTTEQAAVGLGGFLTWAVISLFAGTMTAVTTFVAQSYGAGRVRELRKWVVAGFLLIVPFSLTIAAVYPFLDDLISVVGTAAEVQPLSVTYIRILLLGAPLIMMQFNLTSFLRGLGDTVTPMVVTIIANVINILLDIILIFGYGPIPAMGVAGAAVASVTAGVLGTLIYFRIYFGKKNHELYDTRTFSGLHWEELVSFVRIGLPIGGAWFIENLAWNVMVVYISTLSAVTLAAHTIVFQLISFSFMPTIALSVSASTLVGQYLGAQRPDLAKRSAKLTIIWGMVLMGTVGLIFALLRGRLIALFNDDPAVVATGGGILLIAAAFQIFDAMGLTIDGVLRGAGDTRFPLLARLTIGWALFVPGVFVLGDWVGWGVYGAWAASLLFVVVLGVVMFRRYQKGRWLEMKVT